MSLLSCLYFGVFLLRRVAADYESAGCSDEGCGIPCYLKPPGDNCHYAEHNPCGDEGVTDLDLQLAMLNDSLVRLQEKLIQKNIIPAGTSCPSLKSIENGGIIYSDLILSIGVIANYTCFNDFTLHGHGTYECSTENQWIRTNDQSVWKPTEAPSCENSVVVCEALIPIPSGHISYQTVDTTVVQPGDVAHYSCDTLYKLQGDIVRICLRNGTWSGEEPICIAPPLANTTESSQYARKRNNEGAIAGGILGPIALLGLVALVVLLGVWAYKKRKNRKGYAVMEDIHIGSRTQGQMEDQNDKEHQRLVQPDTLKPDDKQ